MAKKVTGMIKLQVQAGKANPAPPIGPALGQHGVNIPGFCKEFNERTKNDIGLVIPVVITVYSDRSFTFITKTPPAAVLIKKACNIESGSGVPNKTKVATISKEDVRKIAETKMPDLNAASILMQGTPREVFARGGELLSAGLDVPQTTRIAMALRRRGAAIDPAVYTVEDLSREILALRGRDAIC